jgi:ArsR family transcriptional regulator, arsenate/arsenite/antimonite-responsive transcriptional repressor / arsenate reductase (thioredoxin)
LPAPVTVLSRAEIYQSSLIEVRRAGYGPRVAQTVVSRRGSVDPPWFLQLVAHPVRWRLLRELVHSDRAVWELMELLDEPQSLVSYHLRQLRAGELVSSRRSSADRRDSYYSVDLTRCADLLQGAGGALHPGLWLTSAPPGTPSSTRPRRRPRVLFLCTGNSARSQIAEVLLEQLSAGTVEAASAGSHPKPLHPNAVRVMRKQGVDISGRRTKHLSEFLSQRFDFVITLCDRVREICPEFPAHPDLVHWSIPDPALEGATDRANYPAFERTASELETRIRFLLCVINQPKTRRPVYA